VIAGWQYSRFSLSNAIESGLPDAALVRRAETLASDDVGSSSSDFKDDWGTAQKSFGPANDERGGRSVDPARQDVQLALEI
jgi:hypothetical protein